MSSSFDWSHYLHVAYELANIKPLATPSDEGKWRAAISRAYYAAFNKARLDLIEKEHHPPFHGEKDVHQKVWKRFEENTTSPDHQEVAERLERLRALRVRADYRDVFTNLENHAGDAVLDAAAILKLLDSM